ncbi:MAG: histidinol-phosphate transaminase [Clostridia bacterium]|nr:histidinol-phosphate transaminase [Clostridia bacterium]
MSRYFSGKYASLTPYVPGEQPKNREYIKLNTNENPYPPSAKAIEYASKAAKSLELYSDPDCLLLHKAIADNLGVKASQVMATNGSDEILNFAFMAFCDKETPAVFADITYGFYPVFSEINNLPFRTIPLKNDFTIDITDYYNAGGTVFIANPNAPSALALSVSEIEEIIKHNPDNIVVIDEAYVDFGTESCVKLINKYDNLLVTRTFSKSGSMAGARLGYGIACESLILDLFTVKYSTNPYNINSMTMAAGIGALEDWNYSEENCRKIIETREFVKKELSALGFEFTDSVTNFIFAKHNSISGEDFYSKMKENGILIRYFDKERIKDYNRITIGTLEQMKEFISVAKAITEGKI